VKIDSQDGKKKSCRISSITPVHFCGRSWRGDHHWSKWENRRIFLFSYHSFFFFSCSSAQKASTFHDKKAWGSVSRALRYSVLALSEQQARPWNRCVQQKGKISRILGFLLRFSTMRNFQRPMAATDIPCPTYTAIWKTESKKNGRWLDGEDVPFTLFVLSSQKAK